MKNTAYLLITGGFLLGAYATALDIQNVNWTMFGVAAFAAMAGVITAKRQDSARAKSDSVLENNRSELIESIENIVRDLAEMTNGPGISGQALRDRIDEKLRPDLRRFADARQSMAHLFGLQVYADIMSEFAAGERYINRVWSAAADGYDAEAENYLKKAATQFRDAQGQLVAASKIVQITPDAR
jgi:hypothetical protein